MSILHVSDLSVSFTTERGDLKAVRNVSLQLKAGESLGIVGESGSGKTVMSRAIMGLLPHTATRTGSVTYNEQELVGKPADEVQTMGHRNGNDLPRSHDRP